MSIFKQGDGLTLETIVRYVYGEERLGMGGIINSDYFAINPYQAALVALSPFYYSGICREDISNFLEKYSLSFSYPDDVNNMDELAHKYISELNELVKKCKNF